MAIEAKTPVIIGAGIAGPVLAIFLKRAGFSPQIFESTGGPNDAGGALGLAPNGMNVLAAAGVAERVQDVSVTARTWRFENQSGKLLASSPGSDTARYGQAAIMITRAALHRVLVNAAHEQGIPIHFNKRLVALVDTPGQPVIAQFADRTSAEGDLIVGADGIRSQVRQIAMPAAPKPVYTGMMAPGGFSACIDANVTPRSPQDVHFIFGQKGFFGYFNALTAEGPRTAWWSTASASLRSKEPHADLRQRLMALHGDWAQPVPHLIQSATELLDIAIHDVPSLPAWSIGRAIVIGDAAHAVAPHSGQGASMALEDAQSLAKLLRDSPGVPVDKIFTQFEQERRPRTDKVIALGRRNAQRKESISPMAYWIQQQMIRLMLPLTRVSNQDWLLAHKIE